MPAPVARRRLNRAAPQPMRLEQRLMFDGAAVDTTVAVAAQQASSHDVPHDTTDATPVPAPAYAQQRQEIAFIDTSLGDWQALVAGTRTGVEVVLLDPGQDGFQQIGDALAGRSGIDAIHIVSHGAAGMVRLGASQLDSVSLVQQQAELAQWGSHLATDGDVLIYGCDVAASDTGLALLDGLARITGADVAASDDASGGGSDADWSLEYAPGVLETTSFLRADAAAAYQNRLDTINLSGITGWTAIMYGVNKDPVGDSQAGAADTDIVGDASHGSLYTAYDDNGTATAADDTLVFRMRIDNPTSTSYFGGVAIVGMDANSDGRIDLFMSVDGRNNGQAVKLLDPGTGLNISPNTTSTSPLPTGWLANNGVYSFSAANYSVVAVSGVSDPHWDGNNDLGNDAHADAFVSWRLPIADITTVLAKASPVDRNGVYGPRGATGIAGFDQNTLVSYVNFTQTQTGPINGDLNGVGGSYDKNASFASLGVFTAPMSASDPVSASDNVHITTPVDADGLINATEDDAVTVVGTTVANGWVRLTVDDGGGHTATVWTQADGSGNWNVATGDLSGFDQGTLTFSAQLVGGDGSNTVVTGSTGDSTAAVHDTLAPILGVTPLATAGFPSISGTSDLPAGSQIMVSVDSDNVVGGDVIYLALVQSGGGWSVNTATTSPASGSAPAGGYSSYARVTANASDAAGNAAVEVQAITRPTVTSMVTQDTTPTVSGTWNATAGDTLSVEIKSTDGLTTYWSGTPDTSGNTWNATTGALALGTYDVVVTVTRGVTPVSDSSSSELQIVSGPSIAFTSSTSQADTTPTIAGSSTVLSGYITLRIDPNNDGDLADAVTYSVATDGSGNWSLDTGSATPQSGTYPLSGVTGTMAVHVTATDVDGAQASADQALTVTIPSIHITAVASPLAGDATGTVDNGDSYINNREDNSITVSGSSSNAAGLTVTVTVTDMKSATVQGTATVQGDGSWAVAGLDLSSLADGSLKFTAAVTGASEDNTAYTHDATLPILRLTAPSIVDKNTGTVGETSTGTSDLVAGSAITVTYGSKGSGTAYILAGGDWSFTPTFSLTSGSITITAAADTTATDLAGNKPASSTSTVSTISANFSPVANAVVISSIAGDAPNDAIDDSEAGAVVISGTSGLAVGTTITVTINKPDGTLVTSTTATVLAGGTWSTSAQNLTGVSTNGPLVVTASGADATAAYKDVALPTLLRGSVSSGGTPSINLTQVGDSNLSASEDDSTAIAGATSNVAAGGVVNITVSDNDGATADVTGTASVDGSGHWTTNLDLHTLVDGTLHVDVAVTANAQTATDAGDVNHDSVPPLISFTAGPTAGDTTPIIAGTSDLEPGSSLGIAVDIDRDGNAEVSYTVTVLSDHSWRVDTATATPVSGSLPTGGIPASARITATGSDPAGNSTSVIANAITTISDDTGSSTSDFITSDTTLTLSGYAQPGSSVQVSLDAGVIGSVTADAVTGIWTLNQTLTAGSHSLESVATDAAGNTATAVSQVIVVDTSIDVAITAITNDTATPGDFRSNDTQLVFSGTAEADSQVLVTLKDAGNNTMFATSVTADGSGHWSLDRSGQTALEQGDYSLTAQATDAAGNSATATRAVVIDLTGPAIGITSNAKTADTTPVITGTTDLPPGSSITLVIDPDNVAGGATYSYTAIVQADGTWSVDTETATPSGESGPVSYSTGNTLGLTASGSDDVGNSASTDKTLEIGPAPTITVTRPLLGGDYTANAGEDNTVVIQGTSAGTSAGDSITVMLTDGSRTLYDTATVDGSGNWQLAAFDLSAMNDGTLTVYASLSGGGDIYQGSTTFLHDKTPPVPTLSAATNTISAPVTVTVNFDEAVSGLSAADFSASNGAGISDLSGSGTSYSFTLTPVADGSLAVWLAAAKAGDTAGNDNILSNVLSFSVTGYAADASAPEVVSIHRQGGTPQLTNADVLSYRVTFSEAVQNVDVSDFTVTGAGNGGATLQSVSPVAGSGGLQYDVVVGNIDSNNGGIGLGFNSGHDISDTASTPNALAASPTVSESETYTLDNVAPALTPANGATVTGSSLILHYDESLGSITPATTAYSVSASGGAVSVMGVSVSGTVVTLSLSRSIAAGETVSVDYAAGAGPVQDLATNPAADLSGLAVDNINPTVAIAATVTGDSSVADNIINADENDGSFTLNGTTTNLPDGRPVEVSISDGSHSVTKSTTVSGNTWSVNLDTGDIATLDAGSANLTVTVVATAVDGSTCSASKTLGKDVDAPTLQASLPVDDASNVAVDSSISLSFNENVAAGTGALSLYKSDGSLIETFSVGTAAVIFDGTTGLTFTPSLPLEAGTSYYVQVATTAVLDTAGNSYSGIADSTTLNFTTATAGNNAPVLTVDNASVNLAENAAAGSVVGADADATDTDGDILTFSLTGTVPVDGSNNALFSIDAATGQISLTAAGAAYIDYESAIKSYTLSVKANDGSADSNSETITINLGNVDDNPVLLSDSNAAANSVAENAVTGTVVGITALGTDADAGSSISYSLSDDAGGKFAIDAATGVVTVNGALDYETATSHVITVKATSSDGSETSADFSIAVSNVNDNPVLLSDSNAAANSVAESAVTGTVVGITALGTDADAGTSISYSLSDDAGGKFAIDAVTGVVTVNGALDYETATSHVITVKATSSDGSETSADFSIAVSNVNDNPVLLSDSNAAANSVAENAAVGSVVGVTALGTDADTGSSISYSLSDDAGGKFAIDAVTGVVTVAAALDYETATSHVITVKATSSDGSETSADFSIAVSNVDDNPVLLSDSNAAANSVAESAVTGTVVGITALGTDADAGTSISYSLSDDAGGKFAIDAVTGVVTVNAALDYETATSHVITVKATSSDGSETSADFSIAVSNVNDNPVLLSDSNAAANSVAENAVTGTVVGITALGTDADAGSSISYSLSDDAGGKFAIDAATGVVTVNGALDYETATSHVITVKATSSDGSETSADFSIAVSNVNDNPVLLSDSNAAANSVAESAVTGTVVGITALGTDADAGTSISYSLSDDAGGKFAIDAVTGVVTVNGALDYETATSHVITVKATSSDGSETSADFSIAVSNVNDNPVLLSDSNAAANSVAENAAVGSVVGVTALGTDADTGSSISYSLSDDAGGKFAIDAVTGVVTVAAALDYETATSHVITVKATSSDGSETSADFSIAVSNVDDNPVLLSDSNAAANSVAESAVTGTVVGITALGTDADAGTSISYSLSDDAGGKFAIDAVTGVVTVNAALDYETATSHVITVKATSSDGSETSADFSIAVSNVNDNPVLLSDSNAAANSVAESAVTGTVVGITALGTDADAGSSISYSLSDDAGGKFAIDAATGVVTVNGALDYETATSHVITVKATSSDGSETSADFSIAVSNVNDNPVLLSDSNAAANSVAENAAVGSVVGVTALGTDADTGSSISYSLSDDAGGKFAIDAATGVVTVNGALDYETATSHVITVKATSSDGSETSADFSIAVSNVNDNPVLLSDSNAAANSVAESAVTGTVVGITALGTDADAGTSISYSLSDDAGGKFAIDAVTGVVTVNGALDYETATSHVITVKATSSDGSETSADFSIAVSNVNDNPVLLSDSNAAANSVAENAVTGTVVGITALGTDADAGSSISYSLSDDAGGKFAIDAATGVVTVNGALDYETATSHVITVKATSSDGSETSADFSIAVSNVNDNPVLLSDSNAAANSVAESAVTGTVVGITALGTDADAGTSISYSLSDDAGGKFAIDAATGVVTVNGALDYETATSHVITVKATSSDGSETSADFSIAVSNVDDNPVLLSDSNAAANSVAENAAVGSVVGVTALGTDADTGSSISYSLSDDAGGKFAIDAVTGVVTVAAALDYETATSHVITVKATSSDGSETSADFSIAVSNVDDNPVLLSDSNAAANSVAESAVTGTVVGITALGTDADAGTSISYSLSDDAGGKFAIDAVTGVVTVNAALDYETATSHVITVKATSSDGSETSADFSIAVSNVNDNPVLLSDSNAAANSVAENAVTGTVVGITALGTDADAGSSISYSLSDDAGGKFAIDAATGVVTVNGALDYETATSHVITVKATSSDGSETSADFSIAVSNVNDNPVLLSDSNAAANSVAENAAVGSVVGVTALGTDADTGSSISYSLSDDAGGKFAIDAATGVVTVNGALDYETATSHVITVKATSSDGSETSADFSIAVSNVNDNPVLLSDSNAAANSVAENAVTGTVVGVTALGTDADAGSSISYSLSDDAGGKFAIDAATGVVTVNGALDYETATSHVITVKATSSDGSETSADFSIAVSNVNDNPVLLSDSNAAANSVAENAVTGTVVGITALGTDADAGTSISYSLSDDAGGKFAIDAVTGVVTVAAALDYETATSHVITVKATSSDGSETSADFSIAVSNVNDNPVLLSDSNAAANSVAENAVTGTVVGITALGTDADAGTSISYSLSDDAGGKFAIDAATGVVTVGAALDYETATSHVITVKATSSDGSETSADFSIAVADYDEALPAAPLVTGINGDSGLPGDHLTNDTTLVFSGTAEAHSLVRVYLDGIARGTVIADAAGDWSFDYTATPLADGSTYQVTATATDANNNTSLLSDAYLVSIDTSAGTTIDTPSVTQLNAAAAQIVTLSGLVTGVEEGRTVSVTFSDGNHQVVASATVHGGTWQVSGVDLGSLEEGNISVTASVADLAGNAASAIAADLLQIDRSPPAIPSVDATVATTSTPTLTGSATLNAGEYLTVTLDGVSYTVGDGHLSISGNNWTLNVPSALADGAYSVTARVTDAAGNSVVDATEVELVVDTVIPSQPETRPAIADTPQQIAPPPQPQVEPGLEPAPLAALENSIPSGPIEPRAAGAFPVLVEPSATPGATAALRLERNIPDQFAASGTHVIQFVVPMDTFVHSDPSATVTLFAVMADGTALPSWLSFDPIKGEFHGLPPEGMHGELLIKVIARDESGLQAETIVRIRVGEKVDQLSFLGRPGLSAQMKEHGVFAWKAERDRLIQLARSADKAAQRPVRTA